MKTISIVGNARCYHTMDWFRTVSNLLGTSARIEFLTDLIDSESYKVLVRPDDPIVHLYNIDRFLMRRQSSIGNVWRNMVKLAFAPIQVSRLKRYVRSHPDHIYHACTMYYVFVCWLAGIEFVGTPQGSEILVRPYRSRLYKYMAVKALRAARVLTVDSAAMRDEIRKLANVEAHIIQNGVEVEELIASRSGSPRDIVLSMRGLTGLYRFEEILNARNRSRLRPALTLIYPFWTDEYRARVIKLLRHDDRDLGRLDKADMYKLMDRTLLAISIPMSDSSPRSVYEAIFSGVCVAATYAKWYDDLSSCMKARILLIDLADDGWFDRALEFATSMQGRPYDPSPEAIERFSQRRSMSRAIELIYR